MPEKSWVRVEGSGLAVEGPCILNAVIFEPVTGADWTDVYDGLDATAGKLFCHIVSSVVVTWPFCLGEGVPFDAGVYVNDIDGGTATTIIYTPLE